MKFMVDDKIVFELSEMQLKVIQHQTPNAPMPEDIHRRIVWAIGGKYQSCFKKFKEEWEPKLEAAGVEMLPTDPDKFSSFVFEHPVYKKENQ